MDEHDEQDRYVAQLQDVFNSCDPSGSGYLDRHGITLLCQRLQLDEQTPFFLQHLLKDDPHSLISFGEFKDEFISLLTHTIEQVDTIQNQTLLASPECETSFLEREISPKYVRGNKKYGRRSQPDSQDIEDSPEISDSEFFCNRSQSVEIINSIHSSNDTDIMDHDGYLYSSSHTNNSKMFIKRKRRSRSDSESYLSSPKFNDHEHELSINQLGNEAEYLRDIWKKLAVGSDGYLDLSELERVCEHIGMEKLSQEVVSQLFDKLDTDQDGKISFEEFLHVFQNGETSSNQISSTNNTFKTQQICDEKLFGSKAINSSQDERCESTVSTAEAKMFSSLDPENTGFADIEAVTDLWDSLGFPNGYKLLKDLGFKSSKCINLQDLSNSLEEALTGEDAQLHQIAVASMNYELRHLRNYLEQLKIERNKLKSDVSEANTRATLLAQEIDDQNYKLEKSSQSKISMLDKKYKEQIQNLMEEHLLEKEQLNAQLLKLRQTMDSEIKTFREEQIKLQDNLETLRKDNLKFELENRELIEKLVENEKIIECQRKDLASLFELRQKLEELESGETMNDYKYQSVIRELESLKLENQKLRDCNDELVLKVESLQQQLMSRPSARVPSHKRNGSWLGEYVQNSAVKRKGEGTENIIENSSNCVPRMGKVRCKSPELCEEVFINEMGKENLEMYLNQDEHDLCEEDISDDRVGAISYELTKAHDINELFIPPMFEMKQVFQFLKCKIQAEYVNECEENLLQNLKSVEKKNISLENKLKAIHLKYEKDLENDRMKIQKQYESELNVWKTKHAELEELLRQLSCHVSQENKCTLTDLNMFEHLQIDDILDEQKNENLTVNLDVLKEILVIKTIQCEELEKRLKEMEEELNRTIEREKSYFQNCSEIQQEQEIFLTESSSVLPHELAGGDTFVGEELELHSQQHLSSHYESMQAALSEKNSGNSTQELTLLINDFNNLKQTCSSLQETLKITQVNYEKAKELLDKQQCEAAKDADMAKQKILDLESQCSELEDKIKLLQKISDSNECEIVSERTAKCERLKEMEEKLTALDEEHMQQLEELELYWQTQTDTLKQNQEMELIQARAKCVHLETQFNEIVASSVPIEEQVLLSNVATNTDETTWHENDSENKNLNNSQKMTATFSPFQKQFEDNESLKNEKSMLEKECEDLRKRKADLEEEISVIEIEWATLDGISPAKTTNVKNYLMRDNSNKDSSSSPLHLSNPSSDVCSPQVYLSTLNTQNDIKQTDDSENNVSLHLSSQNTGMNEADRINDLSHQVIRLEKKCTYLLNQNKKKEKVFKSTKEQHKVEVENLKQMLRNTQAMLKQQSDEYDHQVEKADSLIKKLYLENAQLMKALQVTEERQKKAEQLNANLHDKCTALTQLVADIYQTAIA